MSSLKTMSQSKSSESGQALIIIIMMMVLSLATGLAVSTRTASTVHQTTNLVSSEEALAAAESAAEEALKVDICDESVCNNAQKMSTLFPTYKNVDKSSACTAFPCYRDFSTNNDWKNYAVVSISNTPEVGNNHPFEFYLNPGDVQQVRTTRGGAGVAFPINVCWQKAGEVAGAIEVNSISGPDLTDPGAGSAPYFMKHEAFDPVLGVGRRSSNNFTAPDSGSGDYANCARIQGSGGPDKTQALRIKVFYAGNSISVKPNNSAESLPYQGNVITVTGYSGDSVRKLTVTKTLPQLPAVFDGVYAGGKITQ